MALFYDFFGVWLLLIQICIADGQTPNGDFRVFKERLTEEYRKLCPSTRTCAESTDASSRNERSPGLPGMSAPMPCCSACSCELDCGDRCCPDMPILEYELSEVNPAQACIYAQYRMYKPRSLNGHSFLVVNKCPSNVPMSETVRNRCELDLSYANITDGRDILPVTSLASGVTYKTPMCATCHGEATTDLYYWEARYMCVGMPMLVAETPEDMFDYAARYDKCNIIYYPKAKWLPIKSCELTIDRCNVTGKWDVYDEFTEAACGAYESVFDGIYKNVHCYLCNHAADVHVDEMCEGNFDPNGVRGNAFVTLLNFNALDKSESHIGLQQDCLDGQFYDKWQKVCRQIVCNTGLVYKQGTCMSLYSEAKGIFAVVAFKIALVPITENNTDNLMIETIVHMLTSIIQREESFDLKSACGIHSFIKLTTSVRDLVAKMRSNKRSIILGDIDYIAIGIQFTVTNVEFNVTRRIEELSNFLRNVTIDGYQITSRNISDKTFVNAYKPNVTFDDTNEFILSNHTAWLNASISNGYDEGGVGYLPMYLSDAKLEYCRTTISISKNTFCTKIVMEAEHFKVSADSEYIYAPGFKDTIAIEQVEFSSNGDFLSVCLESYEFLIRNYIRLKTKEQEHLKPLTIVTIVCGILSLISLAATLIVYCTFPKLRTVPGLNNMGLVTSLIVSLSLMLVNAVVDTLPPLACRIVGITLHYSLMSSFSWMFVCTLHMARVFATITDRALKGNQTKTFIHYVLFVQGISFGIVIATIVACYITSDGDNFGYSDRPCYVEPRVQIYSVAIPIGLVVVLNLFMFAYVIITICRLDDIHKNTSHERHNLIIFVKLSTLTGTTWIFGFLYQFTAVEWFAYAFTIFNASQGVFIMCSFVLNKRVFDMCRSKKEATSSQTMARGYISGNSQYSNGNVMLSHYNKNGLVTTKF